MSHPIRILIIGNGFGGVYALKNLHKFFHKNKKIEISIVGDENYFLFTPLLHEVATGGINPENIIEPIQSVLQCCLKNFYLGKAKFIDTENHKVRVGDIHISYDYLILATGAETNFYDISGASEYSLQLKSIEDAKKIKNHCIAQMERASHVAQKEELEKMLRFVIVGGGATGVELAAEVQEFIKKSFLSYYKKEVIESASVVLIEKGTELASSFGPKVRKKSLEVLRKKGVQVMLNTGVTEVSNSYIVLENKTTIPTDTVIWVAGVKPSVLNFDKEIKKSPNGKLIVNEYLQIENAEKKYKEIFAIGDVALFMQKNSKNIDMPLPALAQVAEKEAVNVAKNIKLLIDGLNPEPFLYNHTGDFISLGQWMAIGEVYNFTFWGHITWWLWRTVYLYKLISWRKTMEVALDWTINLFSKRDISQI